MAQAGEAPFMRIVLDISANGATLHSPAILRGDPPAILWFQGSHEAAHDVEIRQVVLRGPKLVPGPVATVLSAANVTAAMQPPQIVWVLGNTVQLRPGDPRHLLATVVSAGGWAAASLAHVTLDVAGPVAAHRLPLSPLLNRSHLVRNRAVVLEGGDIGVPAYFEMSNGFGEFVRLAPNGRVRAKARIGWGKSAIQPAIVVSSAKTAIALMRPFGGERRLYRAQTVDGGKSWSTPTPLAGIPNPSAPVSALRLADGRILMAFNDSPTQADNLTLAISADDGRTWKRLRRIETPGQENPAIYRYVDMAQLANGQFLLTYSVRGKQGIRARLFNLAWALAGEEDNG